MLPRPPLGPFLHSSRHLGSVTSSLSPRPSTSGPRPAQRTSAWRSPPSCVRRDAGRGLGAGTVARGGAGPRGEGRGRCLQTANQGSGRSKGRPQGSGGERSPLPGTELKLAASAAVPEGCGGGPRRPSGRQRTRMSGPAGLAYLDRRERVLKLGESFQKQPRCAFHTVRCECRLSGVPPGSSWDGRVAWRQTPPDSVILSPPLFAPRETGWHSDPLPSCQPLCRHLASHKCRRTMEGFK